MTGSTRLLESHAMIIAEIAFKTVQQGLSKYRNEFQNKKSAFPCIYRRLCGKSQSI
jgi:hypothetical protein